MITSLKPSRFLLLSLLAGCGASASPPSAAQTARTTADTAGVAMVDSSAVAAPVELPAQLYVEHDAVVIARTHGVIRSIAADLGARVQTGELLAQLEDTDQQIALARAQEAVATSERLALRVRQLTPVGGATVADSESVESRLVEAQLGLRQAQRDLALTRVTAPFDGVVTGRTARSGRLATPGDSLFRVTSLGPLLVAVQLPESASAGVKVGSDAEVRGLRDVSAPARVIRMAPIVDAASGTVPVVLRVEPAAGLRPGSAVTVRLGRVERNVLAVARDAVNDEGIALVRVGGRTSARAVTLGDDLGDGKVEVLGGLAAGEAVVREPQ